MMSEAPRSFRDVMAWGWSGFAQSQGTWGAVRSHRRGHDVGQANLAEPPTGYEEVEDEEGDEEACDKCERDEQVGHGEDRRRADVVHLSCGGGGTQGESRMSGLVAPVRRSHQHGQ